MELLTTAFWATFDIMKNVCFSLFIGLFLANLADCCDGGINGRRLIPWITKITGLPAVCALSVVLAIGDRTAGMAVVAQSRIRAGLTVQEVIAANMVAKAPSVLQYFIFSFIPIMLSMYPWNIAVHFLTIYFMAFLTTSLVGILYARLVSTIQREDDVNPEQEKVVKIDWVRAVKDALIKTGQPLVVMSAWMAGMSFVVMLFIKTGYLNQLAEQIPLLARLGLDGTILSLVGAGMVSMIGGVAAVGAAFYDGVVPADIVVPLLLSISLMHNVYDFFIGSLPRHFAIFGRQLGLKVATAGFVVTQGMTLLVIVLTSKGWL
ncbi:MAG: hypothetical protein ABFC84_13890 [Veillonellales bacterium]